jgi:hypothetical protein
VCRLHWFSRATHRAERKGWEAGYRFAIDGLSDADPLVRADLDDFGSGWMAAVRDGGLSLNQAAALGALDDPDPEAPHDPTP